jgi:predicted MFS family arabinose efflux permease
MKGVLVISIKPDQYKWYILILAMLAFGITTGLERQGIPVLFKEISTDLNLSIFATGVIWGIDPLAGIFISIPGGLLVDRFGVKRTLTVVCFLAGIFCSLRGLSSGFTSLAVTTFLFGLMCAVTPTIAFKITVLWFDKKLLGLANALINVSGFAGAMIATQFSSTVLSPWLGNWRYVLFLFGAPAIILGILWWTTGKEPEQKEAKDAANTKAPFKETISKVLHIKEVWIIGFIMACYMGAHVGLTGYLPLYLRNAGWTPLRADTTITLMSAATLVGMIPMVMFASRLRALKGLLFISIIIFAISIVFIPYIKGDFLIAMLVITSFLRSGSIAILTTLTFQVKGVGILLGGTAMGLTQVLTMGGGFAAPPLGTSLTNISLDAPFYFWSALLIISLPLFILIKQHTKRSELKENAS